MEETKTFDWRQVEEMKREASEVTLRWHGYGFYEAVIQRHYFKKLPVRGNGSSAQQAFEMAKKRVAWVEQFEQEHGLITPPEGKYEVRSWGGKLQHGWKVGFQQVSEGRWEITTHHREDEFGYQLYEPPAQIHERMWPADQYNGSVLSKETVEKELGRIKLDDGEALWIFDNIRSLSGAAGFAVVKDGKYLRSRGAVRS